MATKLNGHSVVIVIGETTVMEQVSAQKDCILTIDGDLHEVASNPETGVRSYKDGLYGWTMQVSGLYAVGGASAMAGYILNKTLLYAGMQIGSSLYSGNVYMSSFRASGNVKGKVTYDITLQGTGELTTT